MQRRPVSRVGADEAGGAQRPASTEGNNPRPGVSRAGTGEAQGKIAAVAARVGLDGEGFAVMPPALDCDSGVSWKNHQ